jgi:hypothetical protein
VLSKLPWRFGGVAGRKRTTGFLNIMCNALLQPWLEMVCRQQRVVFREPVEACPASCVLVDRVDGTCIPVLSANRTF